jgi:hypothetical protein
VAALLLAVGMAPAVAQTPEAQGQDEDDLDFDRACMDDYGRNLCDQKVWAEIVTAFRLEPAESVQRTGLRGVRVFTINGYSNDMPVVSILASAFAKSGEPENAELEVRRQTVSDESKAGPAILKRDAWSDLYRTAVDLQHLAAASPERQPEVDVMSEPDPERGRLVTICMHAWVTVTESLTDAGVVRRIRNACDDDPLFNASFVMSAHALRGFPYCNHLDPKNYRNPSTQLARCFALDGTDRAAAADVANIYDVSLDAAADLAPYLAPDVRLAWPDRAPVSGAAPVIAALGDPAFKEFDLYAGHVVGEAGRVVANGWLDRFIDDRVEFADIAITWRLRDNAWRIEAIAIGPLTIEE